MHDYNKQNSSELELIRRRRDLNKTQNDPIILLDPNLFNPNLFELKLVRPTQMTRYKSLVFGELHRRIFSCECDHKSCFIMQIKTNN